MPSARAAGRVSPTPPPPIVPNSENYPLRNIPHPHPHDVLCGRGGGTNQHIGNSHWRMLVQANKAMYVTLHKHKKMLLSKSIVNAVRSQNPPGRFLNKDPKTDLWYDVGDQRATEKTSQALREGAPDVRSMVATTNSGPEGQQQGQVPLESSVSASSSLKSSGSGAAAHVSPRPYSPQPPTGVIPLPFIPKEVPPQGPVPERKKRSKDRNESTRSTEQNQPALTTLVFEDNLPYANQGVDPPPSLEVDPFSFGSLYLSEAEHARLLSVGSIPDQNHPYFLPPATGYSGTIQQQHQLHLNNNSYHHATQQQHQQQQQQFQANVAPTIFGSNNIQQNAYEGGGRGGALPSSASQQQQQQQQLAMSMASLYHTQQHLLQQQQQPQPGVPQMQIHSPQHMQQQQQQQFAANHHQPLPSYQELAMTQHQQHQRQTRVVQLDSSSAQPAYRSRDDNNEEEEEGRNDDTRNANQEDPYEPEHLPPGMGISAPTPVDGGLEPAGLSFGSAMSFNTIPTINLEPGGLSFGSMMSFLKDPPATTATGTTSDAAAATTTTSTKPSGVAPPPPDCGLDGIGTSFGSMSLAYENFNNDYSASNNNKQQQQQPRQQLDFPTSSRFEPFESAPPFLQQQRSSGNLLECSDTEDEDEDSAPAGSGGANNDLLSTFHSTGGNNSAAGGSQKSAAAAGYEKMMAAVFAAEAQNHQHPHHSPTARSNSPSNSNRSVNMMPPPNPMFTHQIQQQQYSMPMGNIAPPDAVIPFTSFGRDVSALSIGDDFDHIMPATKATAEYHGRQQYYDSSAAANKLQDPHGLKDEDFGVTPPPTMTKQDDSAWERTTR